VSAEQSSVRLEIGHVLFIDIVGYSKLLITEQSELLRKLTALVLETEQVRIADAEGKLIRLPTGDGMALVFRNTPETPAQCALELSRRLKSHPELRVRMGIHSGPVNEVTDVNQRINITGAGINIAKRVMDCGDAGHILLSKRVADDLEQYPQWREHLYELGQVEVKHGVRIDVVNFYNDEVGNAEPPEKFKQAAQASRAAVKRRRKKMFLGAAALIAIGSGIGLWTFSHRASLRVPPISDKSIAVLPLENLTEEKENAYFADGIQDELLSNLAKIKDLKVISRTSVMQYKSGITRNLKEIAQQLGVSNVVEGSVRRSGDHVRVSVQLIDARNDRHVWGENYDRKVADSVSLQGELATEIASALGATLSPQEKVRVEAKPTNNPAAYDAYLRARAIPVGWGFHAEGDLESAIRLYQEAVKLDPNFTLAWAYLSIAQIQSIMRGADSSLGRSAAAKDSLNHALALDPNLPEVHLARGYNEEDDTRSLAEFREAEKGLPNSADVIEAIALQQKLLGHWDEAVANLQRAIELDPRNVRASNNLALAYCAMRRFPEALATLDRVLAWDPTNTRALLTKVDALMAMGDLQAAEPLLANPELPVGRRAMYATFQRNYAAAVEMLSKDLAVDRQQRDSMDILSLAFNQQLAGDIAAARATYQKSIEDFRRQLEKAPGPYVEADTRMRLSEAYAGLGEAASAINEGEKAMALLPSAKDSDFGLGLEDEMARIYAQLGDADHAIPMLKRLLRTHYSGATFLTPAALRLDPIWDPIRNDPRFQELAAERSREAKGTSPPK
jgi:TolB-like protein/cytochrome c-type biogenesis protein CcmH/NrfG